MEFVSRMQALSVPNYDRTELQARTCELLHFLAFEIAHFEGFRGCKPPVPTKSAESWPRALRGIASWSIASLPAAFGAARTGPAWGVASLERSRAVVGAGVFDVEGSRLPARHPLACLQPTANAPRCTGGAARAITYLHAGPTPAPTSPPAIPYGPASAPAHHGRRHAGGHRHAIHDMKKISNSPRLQGHLRRQGAPTRAAEHLRPAGQQAPPAQPRQGVAGADRGAVRQLSRRRRHRALRRRLRPRLRRDLRRLRIQAAIRRSPTWRGCVAGRRRCRAARRRDRQAVAAAR